MSKTANPALIGIFVVGAAALIFGSFAVFGGAALLSDKNRYVAYFVEPTKGLNLGANVLLNGVRIGQVSDIDLLVDEANFEIKTRVTMDVIPDTFIVTRGGATVGSDLTAVGDHDKLIHDAGLRAQLSIESFLTGQLQIELMLRPETEVALLSVDPPYPEIPTVPSDIQAILGKVQQWIREFQEDVDLAEVGRRITSTVIGLDELANSEDLRASMAGLNALINDQETQELTSSINAAVTELRAAAGDAGRFIRSTDKDLGDVFARLDKALVAAEETFSVVKQQIHGESQTMYQLESTLNELELAAQEVREFFDYLERNPEALLRGKSE